jgi:hypothetical protein
MRFFHRWYGKVLHGLGSDLRDLIQWRDNAKRWARTPRDIRELSELDTIICESYDIEKGDFEQWRA